VFVLHFILELIVTLTHLYFPFERGTANSFYSAALISDTIVPLGVYAMRSNYDGAGLSECSYK